ncbi:MAG: acyl-CoA thioesterase domain-containing protein [Pseudomonadales bacterium]
MNFVERIGGIEIGSGKWQFDLAEELNGGFGGTNGGTLAAVCVFVARSVAPGRGPIGIDARFIRGFRPGQARLSATILNEGRTLTTVSVDVLTAQDKLATRATVSLVVPSALAQIDRQGTHTPPEALVSFDQGRVWRQPKGLPAIPLIDTFSPRLMGTGDSGIATGTKIIWDDPKATVEAACIAADISVGPPVAGALKGLPLAMPNPDISLRFTGADSMRDHLVSVCRLEGIVGGLATTSLDVWSGDTLIAVGVSTTTCLKS